MSSRMFFGCMALFGAAVTVGVAFGATGSLEAQERRLPPPPYRVERHGMVAVHFEEYGIVCVHPRNHTGALSCVRVVP